jgi:hypothetical protein
MMTITAFLSYSWDSPEHRRWIASLGARLRADGVDLLLDEWHLQAGDQLSHFMEKAVRESDFVLIVCTPRYREKSNARTGGVGYEGNIMTAELYTGGNERKFIPLLREGDWLRAAPTWLQGKKYFDLSGDPYIEDHYHDLINTLLGIMVHPPIVHTGSPSSAQRLAPQAVTNQTKYIEFINAARKVFFTANKKFVLFKNGSNAATILFSSVERELSQQAELVNNLFHEILILSSEPVRGAAGEVAAWVLAAQVTSMSPTLEGQFNEILAKFNGESLFRFSKAVREEAGLR